MAIRGVTVRTSGGDRLRAHLRRAESGELRRRYLARVVTGMNREYLPILKAKTPKVSGLLASSYQIKREGDGLGLFSGAVYARSVRFSDENLSLTLGERTVADLAHNIARTRLRGIAVRAFRQALRETI